MKSVIQEVEPEKEADMFSTSDLKNKIDIKKDVTPPIETRIDNSEKRIETPVLETDHNSLVVEA